MNKLEGLEPGRYRVTFEGELKEGESGWFLPDGGFEEWRVKENEAAADTFSIEKIAKPYVPTVGDRVTFGTGACGFELVAIRDEWGILWNGLNATYHEVASLRPYEA